MLRHHIIFCFILLLAAIPVYILDHYTMKSSGGNWISLDFRGLLIGLYLIFLVIHIALSSVAIHFFPQFRLVQIHLFTALISIAIMAIGISVYNTMVKSRSRQDYNAMMEKRKPLFDQIQLKRWWYVPNAQNPTEIHADLEVTAGGRFSGFATGKGAGEFGINVFSSEGEAQHMVKANEGIHYIFPLTINSPGVASQIELTFYLFKAPAGQTTDEDIVKIFKESVEVADDGSYFYEVLPPPSSGQ